MSALTIAQCFFSNEAVPLNLVTFPVDSIIAVSLFGNMTVDTVDTGNIATGTIDPRVEFILPK